MADGDPLYSAHDEVNSGAHIVGLKLANETVELGRGRTDAKKKRYLDEDDNKGAYSVGSCQREEK